MNFILSLSAFEILRMELNLKNMFAAIALIQNMKAVNVYKVRYPTEIQEKELRLSMVLENHQITPSAVTTRTTEGGGVMIFTVFK